MGKSQVQGVQWPLQCLLGERYEQITFNLPDRTWTLDNVTRIPDLFKFGREASEIEFDRVERTFFVEPKAQDYVPFDGCDS